MHRDGTSLISLIIPPGEQLTKAQKKLIDELGKASNIKLQRNRKSVEEAIITARERLKLYLKTPQNGLIIYCGNIISEDGRSEKKYTIEFEPFKPLNYSLYYCGEKFDAEPLKKLLEDNEKFGFIIIDGNGALIATLQGSTKTIYKVIKVDLPKKQGRGGSSASRFARNREISRHNYIRKVAELANSTFITEAKPNVTGLILAGSADFKTKLAQSDLFDPRLSKIVIKIVDVSYGFENGLNEAVTLSGEVLGNLKYVQEQKVITKFFEELKVDSPKIVFGVEDSMRMAELAMVKLLIVWESLDYTRVLMKTPKPDEIETVRYLKGHIDAKVYKDPKSGVENEILEIADLNDWILENRGKLGMEVQFVSDRSEVGFQFVKGFGGCAGFLRYAVPSFEALTFNEEEEGDFDPEVDFI